jgi:hypothetical protein
MRGTSKTLAESRVLVQEEEGAGGRIHKLTESVMIPTKSGWVGARGWTDISEGCRRLPKIDPIHS